MATKIFIGLSFANFFKKDMMCMSFFLVSIVIPVYNGSNYLREAIDSALGQTYTNIEVIVVNDGSCDDGKTRKIALSYGLKIRYFEKENGGVSTALNLGIKQMQGEYFSWLSHDDVYRPNKIEIEMNALKLAGDMTVPVHSGFDELIMPQKENKPFLTLEKRYSKRFLESGLCATTIGFISGCSLLIHKSYFEKYGLFDEKLKTTQDYAKWFEMFKDKRMLYIEQPLIQSRIHKEQTGATYKNFHKERDDLHRWMMENVTLTDTKKMGWDLYHFFSVLLPILDISGYTSSYQYACKRLLQLKESPKTLNKIEKLKFFLQLQDHKLYLTCAGKRGKALLNYFRLRGILVEGFCDSNEKLWGRKINGISCFSTKEIEKEKVLLIVTKAEPYVLKNSLLKQGFENVITYDEIEELLCEIPLKKMMLYK
jgi:glycosyltransferase involved in cell wall biosynthesis